MKKYTILYPLLVEEDDDGNLSKVEQELLNLNLLETHRFPTLLEALEFIKPGQHFLTIEDEFIINMDKYYPANKYQHDHDKWLRIYSLDPYKSNKNIYYVYNIETGVWSGSNNLQKQYGSKHLHQFMNLFVNAPMAFKEIK